MRNRYPKLTYLSLWTNGQLLTPREWDNFDNLRHFSIHLNVSIDATMPATYAKIRRLGRFDRLLDNLKFIGQLRRNGALHALSLRFVVQRDNFKEMPAFVTLAQEHAADEVVFVRLCNTSTYSAAEFTDLSVCDPEHPRHGELLRILRDPIFHWPNVNFDNMKDLYLKANSDEANKGPCESASTSA